jgi:hypothetical protein
MSVIGGYTIGSSTFDAWIFSCCEGDRLLHAARTRNGFTPATRSMLALRHLGARQALVQNLVENIGKAHASRCSCPAMPWA